MITGVGYPDGSLAVADMSTADTVSVTVTPWSVEEPVFVTTMR